MVAELSGIRILLARLSLSCQVLYEGDRVSYYEVRSEFIHITLGRSGKRATHSMSAFSMAETIPGRSVIHQRRITRTIIDENIRSDSSPR